MYTTYVFQLHQCYLQWFSRVCDKHCIYICMFFVLKTNYFIFSPFLFYFQTTTNFDMEGTKKTWFWKKILGLKKSGKELAFCTMFKNMEKNTQNYGRMSIFYCKYFNLFFQHILEPMKLTPQLMRRILKSWKKGLGNSKYFVFLEWDIF